MLRWLYRHPPLIPRIERLRTCTPDMPYYGCTLERTKAGKSDSIESFEHFSSLVAMKRQLVYVQVPKIDLAVALTSGLCVQARGRQWSLDIHSGVCGWQRAYVRSTSGRGLKTWQSYIYEPTTILFVKEKPHVLYVAYGGLSSRLPWNST